MTKERHKSRLKRIFLTTVFLTRFLSLGHRNKETILRKKQVRESPQCFVTTNRARHHGPATLEKNWGQHKIQCLQNDLRSLSDFEFIQSVHVEVTEDLRLQTRHLHKNIR